MDKIEEKGEPSWRRAAMPQSKRFEPNVDLAFPHDIVVHATQNFNTGSCIWDAALVLGSYLANQTVFPANFWHGKKICEIGAGCGVTGIVAAHLGADVVLTELNEELKLLENNVSQNPIATSHASSSGDNQHCGSTCAKEFFWGNDVSHLGGPFDVILAADCVYELQLFDLLAKAMVDISSKTSKAYFCIEHRWSDIESWWWKEIKKKFQVRLVPQSEHGTYQHTKIDIYELTRKVFFNPLAN
jgi:predicted nicotinamide N-methyase